MIPIILSYCLRIVACGLILSLLTLSEAGIVVTIGNNNVLPTYFSGTNAIAFGSASIVTDGKAPNGMTKSELYIDGTRVSVKDLESVGTESALVSGIEDPSDESNSITPGNTYLNTSTMVVFDSTKFQHGDLVEIWYRVLGSNGVWYQQKKSAPVYNLAGLIGRYDLNVMPLTRTHENPQWVQGDDSWKSIPVSEDYFSGSKYSAAKLTTKGWTAQQAMNIVGTSTVIHLSSHGGILFGLTIMTTGIYIRTSTVSLLLTASIRKRQTCHQANRIARRSNRYEWLP